MDHAGGRLHSTREAFVYRLAGRIVRDVTISLAISLAAAFVIASAREKIDHYAVRVENSRHLVAFQEQRAEKAGRDAKEAELKGDFRSAARFYDEADGRAKLAEYHRVLGRLYAKASEQFWMPSPVEPRPPYVRLIPERFPGAIRSPRLADLGPGTEPARGP